MPAPNDRFVDESVRISRNSTVDDSVSDQIIGTARFASLELSVPTTLFTDLNNPAFLVIDPPPYGILEYWQPTPLFIPAVS